MKYVKVKGGGMARPYGGDRIPSDRLRDVRAVISATSPVAA